MHRVKHLRREIEENGELHTYCGRIMTKAKYNKLMDTELPMCRRCDDIRLARDLREEQEQEKLIKKGFLEPDLGPNRKWNEY